MTFDILQIPDQLKTQLKKMGFKHPTPVQANVIPHALLHKDLCVCAKTGSGKTAAFLIPIINRLMRQTNTFSGVKALILCPTRELALQIEKVAQQMTRSMSSIRIEKLIGGQSYQQQYTRLQKPIDVLIATPGRLLRHLKQGHLTLTTVETVVLDEADRILDMGFFTRRL
ncbi:MAG: DEAD/DEAH box helicase [Alcaligenaceae bacterium]|nr:DEAD/DEAH box helicase [Alcaligenaceae bacterium]